MRLTVVELGKERKEALVDGLDGLDGLSMMLVWELFSARPRVCPWDSGNGGEGVFGEGS